MIYIPVNNPRKENGDFGPWRCGVCGASNPAFVKIVMKTTFCIVCKGCLLEGIKIIDDLILNDCKEKGIKMHGK